jgi:hypothetical protein
MPHALIQLLVKPSSTDTQQARGFYCAVKHLGLIVLACFMPLTGWAANEGSVPWALDNKHNKQAKLLMPAFSGSFENRSLVLILSPVKYVKEKVEFSVAVNAACLRSPQLAKKYQVTTYPTAENGGRFKLALPKHLARCFKVDPKGEISVQLDFHTKPSEELVSLRGSAFIE